jgi:hypothetical protein
VNLGSDIVRKIGVTFRELDELNRCLHEQPDGAVGGPLHIITDDGNVKDDDILFCFRNLEDNTSYSVVVRLVAREMLRLLSLLTAPQRFMWYWAREIEEIGQDPVAWACQVEDGELKDAIIAGDEWDTVVVSGEGVIFPGMKALRAKQEEKS